MTKSVAKTLPRIGAALQALEASGLRCTQPRVKLLKALIARHGPFSVEELSRLAGAPRLDRVTVYRCLTAFEAIRLVRRCEFGDGVSRYEFSMGENHHHHVVCRKCRQTQTIDECFSKELVRQVERLGFSEVSHTLEFFGICRGCRSKDRAKDRAELKND
jgi:Fur family ferric uptake transcriptional regulator